MIKILLVFSNALFVAGLSRSIIKTPNAPGAIGPYSQGVVLELASGERLISAAGQIGLDPASGRIVPGGIVNEAHQAMNNV